MAKDETALPQGQPTQPAAPAAQTPPAQPPAKRAEAPAAQPPAAVQQPATAEPAQRPAQQPLQQPSQPQQPAVVQPPLAGGDTPDWARQLEERVARLSAQVGAYEEQRRAAQRGQELQSLVAPLPAPLRAVYGRLPVGRMDEAEWAAERARVVAEVQQAVQVLTAQGYSFTPPQGGAGGGAGAPQAASDEELKVALARAHLTPRAAGNSNG